MRPPGFLWLAVGLVFAGVAAAAAPQEEWDGSVETTLGADKQEHAPSGGSLRGAGHNSSADGCGQTPGYHEWDTEMPRVGGGGESRITGGQYQHWGQFPSFVSLVIPKPRGEPEGFCGGTLISPRHVLTAAHCLQERTRLTGFRALLGPFQPGKYNESEHSVVAIVPLNNKVPACVAPGYRYRKDHTPDWAVVELARDADYGPNVQPACLPAANSPAERRFTRSCWAVGAGISHWEQKVVKPPNPRHKNRTSWIGHKPLLVKRLRVEQVNCPASGGGGSWFSRALHPTKVCYEFADPALKGEMCYGDSGGPVLCRDEAPRRWTLAALINGGFGQGPCGQDRDKQGPTIFTDVGRILAEMRRVCNWMDLP